MCVGSGEKFEVYERPEVYEFAFSRCLEAEVHFFEDLRQSYSLPSESKVLDMGCGWLGQGITVKDSITAIRWSH